MRNCGKNRIDKNRIDLRVEDDLLKKFIFLEFIKVSDTEKRQEVLKHLTTSIYQFENLWFAIINW